MTGFDALSTATARGCATARAAPNTALSCNIIAGCDGFHGVCRPAIPDGVLTSYDHVFPFGPARTPLRQSPPIKDTTYANHDNGFALRSCRSPKVSRHYVQVAPDEDAASWSDDPRSGANCISAWTTPTGARSSRGGSSRRA